MSNIPGVTEFPLEKDQPKQLTETPTWSESSVKLREMDQARLTIAEGLAGERKLLSDAELRKEGLVDVIAKLRRRAELLPGDRPGCLLLIAQKEQELAQIERALPGRRNYLAKWEAAEVGIR